MMTEPANQITMDEATNAVDFLEKAALFLKRVPDDPMYWKWVIISLHAALYGIGVCSVMLMDRKDVIRTTKKGKELLLGFDEIMKMCQDPRMMTSVYEGEPLVLSDDQKKALDHLKNTFRNNFEHFAPTRWTIILNGLPKMTADVMTVIRSLALENGTRRLHLGKHRNRLETAIQQIEADLKTIQYTR